MKIGNNERCENCDRYQMAINLFVCAVVHNILLITLFWERIFSDSHRRFKKVSTECEI